MPKKRANGEGSLRKRKDGRWEGRYTAGCDPTTGKPIHKSVLAKTQSEAKEKLKQAIAEAEKLDMSRAKSYTLGAWIKLWYEVYAEPRLREKTKHYYLNYIDNHIVPELGGTPLEKLTTIQIQKFYNDLQKSGRIQRYTHIKLKDKGLSTRVVRGIHTLLNNCLEQAVAERLLLANPAKGCRLPKLEKREMKILPEDKIGPYLAEAERRGLLAAFYLELTTGLRRGELLALLEKILKAIGAEHIRFHDLRHTFATLSLKYGVDVKTLSGALGHYDAGFTLSTYTHATEGMKRSAADTIGSVISQTM